MSIPEWLFGPAGDLRPLPSPEMDVVNTVQRFGGVHNAINGARTVDVLGHRANYEFGLNYLVPDEYHWIEALYTETIPGPFYLIDPLRKNLLSREAATARPADASRRGLKPTNSSSLNWVRISDSPVSWIKRGVKWSNLTVYPANGAGIEIDGAPLIPIKSGTPVTFSVYAKASQDLPVHHTVRYYNESEALIGGSNTQPLVTLPANTWFRLSQTYSTFPTGAVTLRPELWYEPSGGATSATSVQFIGFQVEYGTEATDLALGGGSMKVVIESMDTVSPYFPYQNVSLKLMEV